MTGTIHKIETLKKGELVHKLIKGQPSKKLYQVAGYCRFNKAYQLDHYDDISAASYLKKGKLVALENGCAEDGDGENF